MTLCDYGCEQEAKYKFKNGRNCCSSHSNKCLSKKKKARINNLGENNPRFGKPGTMLNKHHRQDSLDLMSSQRSGENNPNYKDGSSMRLDEWREKILSQGDNFCYFCSKMIENETPYCHHIYDIKTYPDLIYDTTHGVKSHNECHSRYHRQQDWTEEKKIKVSQKLKEIKNSPEGKEIMRIAGLKAVITRRKHYTPEELSKMARNTNIEQKKISAVRGWETRRKNQKEKVL